MNSRDDWPFDQPRSYAVKTTRPVMEKFEPILAVYHGLENGGWQFLGKTDASKECAAVISLEEAVALDPSILKVADLLPGSHATRINPTSEWERHIRQLDDDPWGLDPGVTPKSLFGALLQTIARLFRSR